MANLNAIALHEPSDPTKITTHSDGTVTLWNVFQRQWIRGARIPAYIMASLPDRDRDRVLRHVARTAADLIAAEHGCGTVPAANGRIALEHCARGCGACSEATEAAAQAIMREMGVEVLR